MIKSTTLRKGMKLWALTLTPTILWDVRQVTVINPAFDSSDDRGATVRVRVPRGSTEVIDEWVTDLFLTEYEALTEAARREKDRASKHLDQFIVLTMRAGACKRKPSVPAT